MKPCLVCGRPGPGARCPAHVVDGENRLARAAIYADPRHRRLRAVVLERDGFTCRLCGHRDRSGRSLVCDHVGGVLNVADPFDPAGCQTLCLSCSGRKDGARSHGGHPPSPTARPTKPSSGVVIA